jgi:hypothetical protein
MANIRDLKKDINNLCFEVISECVIFQHYSSSLFFENVQEIIAEAVELRNELIFKVNHPPLNEDKKAVKAHYRSIVDELFEKTIALIERLNSLPEELKESKKKSPAKKKNVEPEEDQKEEVKD